MNKFLHTDLKLPYCKGCGHSNVLRNVAAALEEINIDPLKCIVVTDIGCVGLADKYLKTHTVHTLHGRSTAIATGIKIAEKLDDEDTKIIVLIGDGGATIGLLHLVEAARLNVDITVLLHNNFLYGMTGGQHSSLTPEKFITRTTPYGNPSPSLDILSLLDSAKAGFLARTLAQSRDLKGIIKQAISFKGFSIVEIVEICTGYAARFNKLNKREIEEILRKEKKPAGILKKEEREYIFKKEDVVPEDIEIPFIEKKFSNFLEDDFSVLLAGSAGEGVQFSAEMFARSAIACGLYVTQKNDNPVTVGSGFSTCELKFSKKKINYTGIVKPDYVILTSMDGFLRIKNKLNKLNSKIIADTSIKEVYGEKRNFRKFGNIRSGVNISALSFLLKLKSFIPFEAFAFTLKKYGEELLNVAKLSYDDNFP